MKDITFESVKANFTNYLVKNKYRKTPERFAILEHINELNGHFTAEFLFESMKNNFRVSLASIYNNLELFQKAGLIFRHQFGNNPAEYERVFRTTVHHHLICLHCGKIKEFTDKDLKESIESKNFNNFLPTHFTLYIHGYCNKCKKYKLSTINK